MTETLRQAALFLDGALVGAMLFFAAIVAPTVFRTLDGSGSRHLMRRLFPRYYLVLAVVSLLAAAAAAPIAMPAAVVLALTGAGFLWARQELMPRINWTRDAADGGDTHAARRFTRLHRLSVALNSAQLVALVAAFAVIAIE